MAKLSKFGYVLQLVRNGKVVADSWGNDGIEGLWARIFKLTGLRVELSGFEKKATGGRFTFLVNSSPIVVFSNNSPLVESIDQSSIEAVNAFMEVVGWMND